MKPNVGSTDKMVRALVAVVAVVLAFVTGPGSALGIILFVVAAIAALTALVGVCPLYKVLGMNTCPVDKRS
ncbi:MAG TPA: DUF2892 domain-containing protein [Miltoncostaeales bacterium]|jgi:hypothetical protein|nr:DUF2892 domain-containing protein [Miltoncostaeales bacterium]